MTPQPVKRFVLPPPEQVGARQAYELEATVLDDDGNPRSDDGTTTTRVESFTTIPAGTMPSAVLMDLSVGVSIVDGRVLYGTRQVVHFLRATLRREDRGRFDAFVRDPTLAVNTAALGDVAMWLVDALTLTPSGGPSNSPGGRPAPQGSSGPESGNGANDSTT